MHLIKSVWFKKVIIYQIVLTFIVFAVTTVSAVDSPSPIDVLTANELQVPSQFETIQSAINAATAGVSVRVSPGTYNENIKLRSNVSIRGCGDDCIIQGNRSSATVFASGVTNATIEGFKITGGGGYRTPDGKIFGGGIYADRSTINIGNNNITLNNAEIGAGIALLNSQYRIYDNTISDNLANTMNSNAVNMAGGIYSYNSHGEINSNEIVRNKVDNGHFDPNLVAENRNQAPGGGIAIVFDKNTGVIKIILNTISHNAATGSQYYGGGVYMYQTDKTLTNQVLVMNNNISSNQALDGGGIAIIQMSPIISGNIFFNNTAHWGGGIYGWNGAGFILQNRFDSNKAIVIRTGDVTGFSGGGGMLCEIFAPFIAQNTFHNNSAEDYAGALELYDSREAISMVWNNLFSDNTARLGGGVVVSTAMPDLHPMFIRNYFMNNSASESGGALFAEKAGNLYLKNNIFADNFAASWGGAVSLVDLPDSLVENNTFDDNSVDVFWGALHTYMGSLTLRNNQFSNNNTFAVGIDGSTAVNRDHNNFYNNNVDCFQCPASNTELSVDPVYKMGVSFKLSADSPHLHSGNPLPEWNNRDGSINEVGAYGGSGGGFIVNPGELFSSPAADSNQAVYDAATQKVMLPSVELGIAGGSLNVDLQLASCSSSSAAGILVKVLFPSIENISNMEANPGAVYLAGSLFIPSLAVGNSQYSVLLSLFSCASDPAGLYLEVDSLVQKN